MKEWIKHTLRTMDGQDVHFEPPCSFFLCLYKKDMKKDNFYHIVDFGIFDNKPKYNFIFDILSFKRDIFRIPLLNPVIISLHSESLSMHDIKRVFKPGMWLNLPHNGLDRIGIFQGFYSRRQYIFKVSVGKTRDSDSVLFSPLIANFKNAGSS